MWPYYDRFTSAVEALTREMALGRTQRATELEWFKSQLGSATKRDLDAMEERLNVKASELKGQADEIKNLSLKVLSEIRSKIDQLNDQLNDPELPADAVAALADAKATLSQLDEIVPDAGELPPPTGGNGDGGATPA